MNAYQRGQHGCTDIEDAAEDLRDDAEWIYDQAREFAEKVLDKGDTENAEHYAKWLSDRVLNAGGIHDYNPIHFVEIKRWACEGHGPDWLRICTTPPEERNPQ